MLWGTVASSFQINPVGSIGSLAANVLATTLPRGERDLGVSMGHLYYKFYNSFSHESDLRLAVGKNQNALSTALLRNSPANKNAQFCNARVSHVRATPPSKHAFSMRDDNFRRRMRPRERRARSNRRVRADPRLTSGGDGDRFRLFLTETA